MLPKEDFTRAEGMLGLSAALSGILAPVFAASLLDRVEFAGIMTIDLLTFLAAFVTLAWIRVPQPTVTQVGRQSRGDLGQETRFGFRYIRERPSLAALAGLFMAANVFIAIGATLLAPLILSGTGNDQSALATVQSMGAIGGVIGGAILSVWGGPKRRIHGILLGGAGACLLGIAWLGWSRAILFWAVGSFFFSFFEPYVEGGNIALWQTKVEADVQGRVFSARQLLVQIPYLLGIFIAGPLAEQWSIPAVMIGAGVCGTLAFVAGYGARAIRNAETLLPDAARESE
jgi:hypothetical protein